MFLLQNPAEDVDLQVNELNRPHKGITVSTNIKPAVKPNSIKQEHKANHERRT